MDLKISIGIIILVVSAGTLFLIDRRKRAAIYEYLSKQGATKIIIKYAWFDFDRSNNTYDVSYEDKEGKPRTRSCKIGFLDDIYWRD